VAGFPEMGVGGAGDCERGVVEVLFCCGGPLAQADFDGSWGGFFGVDAVADLLIECGRVSPVGMGERSGFFVGVCGSSTRSGGLFEK
jgi:hypothetical protein